MDGPAARRRLVVIAQPDTIEVDEFVALFDGEDSVVVDVITTERSDEVDAAVAQAVDRGADSIAAVGGDGAINIVAGALVRSGADVTLAPVPAGTVNLATQVLGLPDAQSAADAVLAGRSRVLDLGETDQGLFVLNASTGFDAAVIDDADDHSDVRFGRLSFLRAGIRRLRRESGERVRVEADGEVCFDGRAMSVIVMNVGQRVSDALYVAPDAEPDDGLLDVVVVRADTVWKMVRTVWNLVRRSDARPRDVVRARGTEVRAEWAADVASQRDGDAGASTRSVRATCRPGVLRVHHG